MENRLNIILAFAIILFIVIMINFIKKDTIHIKYALVWLSSGILMLIAIVIPNFLKWISHLLGFELVSNMIFLIAIMILLLICFSFTIIVSRQNRQIKLLIQEVSMIKSRIEKIKKKVE